MEKLKKHGFSNLLSNELKYIYAVVFLKLQKPCVVQATLQFPFCYVLHRGEDVFIAQPHNINFM